MPHPRSKRLLSVYPNPYVLDHNGRLSGVVRYDPDHGRRGEVHFVGATQNKGIASGADKAGHPERKLGGGRHTRFDVTHTFEMWPHPVPHTDYFVAQVKANGLVAADEYTAKLAGQSFIPAEERLLELKARAIAVFTAEYGQPPDESEWPNVTPYRSLDAALAAGARGMVPAPPPPAPPAAPPLIVPETSNLSAAQAADGEAS